VAEPLAIGDLVTWRVDAALQCGAQWRQCRFDLHTLSRIQQPLTGPLIQRRSAFGEACPITVDHQFAVGAPGETVQSVLLAPAAQNLLAVQGQAQQMSGVAAVDRAPAGRQEAQAPAPLPQARPRTEAQGRRLPAQHPAQCLQRHAGIGQGRDVAIAQLAAVREAGFQTHVVTPFDQLDRVPLAHQRISGGQPDDAAADDCNTHALLLVFDQSSLGASQRGGQ